MKKILIKIFYSIFPKKITRYLEDFYVTKLLGKIATKEEVFSFIWRNGYWNDAESVSGGGSTIKYTQNIRKELPRVFKQYNIKKVFDAPCGDFNWMKEVLKNYEINYTGGDIVKGLIENNNSKYQRPGIDFMVFDLTSGNFPAADLWICRDCLFHLSYRDILSALKQYVHSGIPYMLTTTHINKIGFANRDILTGGYRLIDVFSPPFNFDQTPIDRFDDYIEPYQPREMCLFSREQILKTIPSLESSIV